MICDSTGSYENLYTYDDFGDFRKKDESVSNSYCYTGQERDENPSGLYNLRARYYASGMGRFTQEDPVFGIAGLTVLGGCCGRDVLINNQNGANLYIYAFNNPMRYTDITGLDACADLTNCLGAALTKYEKGLEDCRKQREDCMNDPCIDFKQVCTIQESVCQRKKGRERLSNERQCNRKYKWPCILEKIDYIIPLKYIKPLVPFYIIDEDIDEILYPGSRPPRT